MTAGVQGKIMSYLNIFWNKWLQVPLDWIHKAFKFDTATSWKATGWKIFLLIVIAFLLYEIYIRAWKLYRKYKRRDEILAEGADTHPYIPKDSSFTQSVTAARDLEGTIDPLKKAKRYDRIGEIYSSLNRPKEAAKWFGKAGDKRRAGMELAKAGATVRAARMLAKAGDHVTAARFYAEKGKYKAAAQQYLKQGQLCSAAAAFAQAKRYNDAGQSYENYFATTQEPPDAQAEAADLCYQMLQQPAARKALNGDRSKKLLLAVAQRFATAQRYDLAARLYQDAGDLAHAGDIYLKAGKLQEAAQCFHRAGRQRDAVLLQARWLEQQGQLREAGAAYQQAGEFRRAGDCFSKALEPIRAAECYEQAGEFFGAGFALVHSDKWESAIKMFQRVKEADPNFNESRKLLGRCFYELRDYAHCVATLENHLTGEKVKTGNIEYFWMLALAYEQEGELDKSKQILLKIRSVDVGYRDVSARLSNIESRISMAPGTEGTKYSRPGIADAQPNVANQATAVMNLVESAVGKRYKLEKELGRGGMGVVYLARDEQLDRLVALKFLGSLLDDSEEYKQRFIREAQTAARVSHPNIISIYDISANAGEAYIAMEYIDGPNLHRYLQKKGTLAPREAVNIVQQACAALQAIHDAGIVHRDIKPDNIILAKGGLVKLMDFGLAKGAGARMTASNVVMGTPCYMAPEQALAKDTDARTDIYAIGLVLHELLTGKTVFAEGNVLQRQVQELPAAPGAAVEGIPPLLDQIVMKCLAKKPEERFQSAQELAKWLRQVDLKPKAEGEKQESAP
jgi:tetratricopeptide (TPR) repeat protein